MPPTFCAKISVATSRNVDWTEIGRNDGCVMALCKSMELFVLGCWAKRQKPNVSSSTHRHSIGAMDVEQLDKLPSFRQSTVPCKADVATLGEFWHEHHPMQADGRTSNEPVRSNYSYVLI